MIKIIRETELITLLPKFKKCCTKATDITPNNFLKLFND